MRVRHARLALHRKHRRRRLLPRSSDARRAPCFKRYHRSPAFPSSSSIYQSLNTQLSSTLPPLPSSSPLSPILHLLPAPLPSAAAPSLSPSAATASVSSLAAGCPPSAPSYTPNLKPLMFPVQHSAPPSPTCATAPSPSPSTLPPVTALHSPWSAPRDCNTFSADKDILDEQLLEKSRPHRAALISADNMRCTYTPKNKNKTEDPRSSSPPQPPFQSPSPPQMPARVLEALHAQEAAR